MILRSQTILIVIMASSANAHAVVVEFTNKSAWETAASAFTTIRFTELPPNTLVVDQYDHHGVTFTDGEDYTYHVGAFINDGAGLNGAFDEIAMAFSTPVTSIAVDFPGYVRFELYNDGELFYTSSDFSQGGVGNFGGLISTEPFDAAVILDVTGGVFIDDLHFGPPIPGAGVWPLTAALAAVARRRRPDE